MTSIDHVLANYCELPIEDQERALRKLLLHPDVAVIIRAKLIRAWAEGRMDHIEKIVTLLWDLTDHPGASPVVASSLPALVGLHRSAGTLNDSLGNLVWSVISEALNLPYDGETLLMSHSQLITEADRVARMVNMGYR